MLSAAHPRLFDSHLQRLHLDDHPSPSLKRQRLDCVGPLDFDAPTGHLALMSQNSSQQNFSGWQDDAGWNNFYWHLPTVDDFNTQQHHQQQQQLHQQQQQQPAGGFGGVTWPFSDPDAIPDLSHQPPAFYSQQVQSSQQTLQPQPQRHPFPSQLHRRALSNSSAGTFESTLSPYPQSSPAPQYLSPHYFPHSYPTPVHSPVRDAQSMATGGKKRSHSAIRTDSSNPSVRAALASRPARTASGDTPAHFRQQHQQPQIFSTSQASNGDDQQEPRFGPSAYQVLPTAQYHLPGPAVIAEPPKLGRTMTDVYSDNLYDPSQQFTAAAEQEPLPHDYATNFLTPNRQVQQAVNAANEARSVSPKAVDGFKGAVSPFRKNSDYYPGNQMQTAAGARQQQKAESDRLAYEQHHKLIRENSDQKTISPQEALLDIDAAEGNPPPLFADTAAAAPAAPMYGPHNANNPRRTRPSSSVSLQGSAVNGEVKYGTWQQPSSSGSQEQPEFPAQLVSMETTKSEATDSETSLSAESPVRRPSDTTAGSGTYTCTYHGCIRRFESPAKLQKHKREDHRSTGHVTPGASTALAESSAATSMTQAGPHRCERINPQTGKPCNTVFSRPYDLTRHEDTIHNRQKTKVKCPYCTEEKTFSRSDALTRHLKVVHPQVALSGKHRKESGS